MMKSITLSAAALALVSTAAFAGLKQPAVVDVDLVNQFASGDMLTAANSKDDNVFIGCGTRNIDDGAGGGFSFGFCQAEDADAEGATCFTENPVLLTAIRGLADQSFISFSWQDDGAGNLTCQSVGVSTQSFYIDKVKN